MNDSVALRRRQVVPAPVFAVLLFLFVDVMFFTACMSSYYVIKRGRTDWIPASVHLPVWPATFSTFVLLLSGFFMIAAVRKSSPKKGFAETRSQLGRALILGLLFLAFQLSSAIHMVRSGLAIQSSVFAGCYFMLIGAHALNVLAGVVAIAWVLRRLGRDPKVGKSALVALQFFWLFVVGIWPVLYAQIYLGS